MKKKGASEPVDIHVGQRIKMQRRILGISQGELGKAAGVTFQQIQKYEKGKNRVSSSRLQQFANVLNVPAAFFFEGLGGPGGKRAPNYLVQLCNTPGGLALAQAFVRIKSKATRKSIVELAGAVAETCEAQKAD